MGKGRADVQMSTPIDRSLNRILRSDAFQRFWSVFGSVSVLTKVLGIVLGTVILLGVFVTIQVRQSLTNLLREELEQQGLSIATHIAENAAALIEGGNAAALDLMLTETQAHYSDARHNTPIDYLYLARPDGVLMAQSYSAALPAGWSDAQRPWSPGDNVRVWREGAGRSTLDAAEAVALHDGTVAVLHVGLSDVKIRAAVRDVTRQLVITSVLMSLAGIAAAVFLTWIITRPIRNLVHATQAVAQGDLSQRVAPWANDEIGRLALAFNSMTESLAQAAEERAARDELRAQYVNRVIAAQEEERRRIARELHDSTSQSLTSLLVGLRALEQDDPAQIAQHTEDLRKIVGETLEEVNRLAWQLRPSALDDLGLAAALKRYVADYRDRYGLPVDLVIRGVDEQRLSPEVETTVYRIVQEALTNVVRHAQADTVSVMIDCRDNAMLVIVEDNGIGLQPEAVEQDSRRLGLYGIRERAELLGGKFVIESEPGQGTSLFVEIPACQPDESDGQDGHGS